MVYVGEKKRSDEAWGQQVQHAQKRQKVQHAQQEGRDLQEEVQDMLALADLVTMTYNRGLRDGMASARQ